MGVDWVPSTNPEGERVSLSYESFGIRRVVVEAYIWPELDDVDASRLSDLSGVLNKAELFTACHLNPPTAANFAGDVWTYDLTASRLRVRCFGFPTEDALIDDIRKLLDGTRSVGTGRRRAFYSDEIRVFAEIPETGKREVGDLVQAKLLKPVKREDRTVLPGLDGAGLQLSGEADDYTGRATIDHYSSSHRL